jgi:hypothetical protein
MKQVREVFAESYTPALSMYMVKVEALQGPMKEHGSGKKGCEPVECPQHEAMPEMDRSDDDDGMDN